MRNCPSCHVGVPAGTTRVFGATLWCPHCDHEMGPAGEEESRPKTVDAAAQRARLTDPESVLPPPDFGTFPEAVAEAKKLLSEYTPGKEREFIMSARRVAAALLESQANAGWWGRFASRALDERDKAKAELLSRIADLEVEVGALEEALAEANAGHEEMRATIKRLEQRLSAAYKMLPEGMNP